MSQMWSFPRCFELFDICCPHKNTFYQFIVSLKFLPVQLFNQRKFSFHINNMPLSQFLSYFLRILKLLLNPLATHGVFLLNFFLFSSWNFEMIFWIGRFKESFVVNICFLGTLNLWGMFWNLLHFDNHIGSSGTILSF